MVSRNHLSNDERKFGSKRAFASLGINSVHAYRRLIRELSDEVGVPLDAVPVLQTAHYAGGVMGLG